MLAMDIAKDIMAVNLGHNPRTRTVYCHKSQGDIHHTHITVLQVAKGFSTSSSSYRQACASI